MWPLAALALAVVVAGAVTGTGPLFDRVTSVAFGLAFIVSGALLVVHRPDNPVSWLVTLPVLYFVGDVVADAVREVVGEGARLWVLWAEQALFAPTVFPVAALLPLLFPTGRPPTPRWRWAVPTGVAAVTLLTIGNATAPDLLLDLGLDGVPADLANPAAVLPVPVAGLALTLGSTAFVTAFLTGVAAIVVRARRASGVERQQLRWFARAAALALTGWLLAVVLEGLGHQDLGGPAFGTGLSLLPVAVAVAILRFRLYDLDRVVSRTITYALVTAVLVSVYAGMVVAAQRVVGRGGEVSDVAIAASTLTAAALFRPVLSRLRALVDHRFNRTGEQARRSAAEFGQRVRDEVDLHSLTHDLQQAVTKALQPTHVAVWTSAGAPERPTV